MNHENALAIKYLPIWEKPECSVQNGNYKSFVTYEPEENIGPKMSYNLIFISEISL